MTTNSLGWEIQQQDKHGQWVAITEPFETQAQADKALREMNNAFPYVAKPRRVYEALDTGAA